jgi:hypothetical protein
VTPSERKSLPWILALAGSIFLISVVIGVWLR